MKRSLRQQIEAAQEAGKFLRAGLYAEKGACCKSHQHDPVTRFDRRAEEVILTRIKRAFPNHGFLSEEGPAKQKGSPYCWVIDPLDGTNNFLREYPQFAVSLALKHGQTSLVGCTCDPSQEEFFTAIRGSGALLNGKRMQVSDLKGEPLIDSEAGILATNRCIHAGMLKILQYGIGLFDSTVFPSGQPVRYSRTIPKGATLPSHCRSRGCAAGTEAALFDSAAKSFCYLDHRHLARVLLR